MQAPARGKIPGQEPVLSDCSAFAIISGMDACGFLLIRRTGKYPWQKREGEAG